MTRGFTVEMMIYDHSKPAEDAIADSTVLFKTDNRAEAFIKLAEWSNVIKEIVPKEKRIV